MSNIEKSNFEEENAQLFKDIDKFLMSIYNQTISPRTVPELDMNLEKSDALDLDEITKSIALDGEILDSKVEYLEFVRKSLSLHRIDEFKSQIDDATFGVDDQAISNEITGEIIIHFSQEVVGGEKEVPDSLIKELGFIASMSVRDYIQFTDQLRNETQDNIDKYISKLFASSDHLPEFFENNQDIMLVPSLFEAQAINVESVSDTSSNKNLDILNERLIEARIRLDVAEKKHKRTIIGRAKSRQELFEANRTIALLKSLVKLEFSRLKKLESNNN